MACWCCFSTARDASEDSDIPMNAHYAIKNVCLCVWSTKGQRALDSKLSAAKPRCSCNLFAHLDLRWTTAPFHACRPPPRCKDMMMMMMTSFIRVDSTVEVAQLNCRIWAFFFLSGPVVKVCYFFSMSGFLRFGNRNHPSFRLKRTFDLKFSGGPLWGRLRSQSSSLKPDESEGCSPVSCGRTIKLCSS
jgi:hypothetical protein